MGTNTPNLNLYQYDPTESMANPQGQFDGNWTIIDTMDNLQSVTGTAFPHGTPGQLAWFPSYSGAFVCMADQPAWQGFWKPVNKRYGPWQDIPSSVLSPLFVQGTPTAQFRFSIDGLVELRGTLKLASGNFSTTQGFNYNLLVGGFP